VGQADSLPSGSFKKLLEGCLEIGGEATQCGYLLRLGFLLEVLRDEVRSITTLDKSRKPLSSENAGAAHATEPCGRTFHEGDEAVALKYIMCGDFDCGQQLNSRRGQPFKDFSHLHFVAAEVFVVQAFEPLAQLFVVDLVGHVGREF
jgi:hypothetical protein